MLTGLSIRDVVLIEALDLEFGAGLGVLTGETGAGKSILLDALGLALGGRGDSALVRHGAAQAVVTASFESPPRAARRIRPARQRAHRGRAPGVARRRKPARGRARRTGRSRTRPRMAQPRR